MRGWAVLPFLCALAACGVLDRGSQPVVAPSDYAISVSGQPAVALRARSRALGGVVGLVGGSVIGAGYGAAAGLNCGPELGFACVPVGAVFGAVAGGIGGVMAGVRPMEIDEAQPLRAAVAGAADDPALAGRLGEALVVEFPAAGEPGGTPRRLEVRVVALELWFRLWSQPSLALTSEWSVDGRPGERIVVESAEHNLDAWLAEDARLGGDALDHCLEQTARRLARDVGAAGAN